MTTKLTTVDFFNAAVGEFVANVPETRAKHALAGDAEAYILAHELYHKMTPVQRAYYVACVENPAVIVACKNVRLAVEAEGIMAAGPWGP